MTRRLHIALWTLLGLFVLAACQRAEAPSAADDFAQVTEGPVDVSLILSIKGFGGDDILTKGDFVDVDERIHYDHEKIVSAVNVYLFDSSDPDVYDATGNFHPEKASYLNGSSAPRIIHTEVLPDGKVRVDFSLSKPYASLAALVLANYYNPDTSPVAIAPTGSNMKEVGESLFKQKVTWENGHQDMYFTQGVPMYGWQVFGTEAYPLKYYKGMSTPLTRKGFTDAATLAAYAGALSGKGTVQETDCVPMKYALARLRVSYEQASGQVDPLKVTPRAAHLNGFCTGFRVLSYTWAATEQPTPFDPVKDASYGELTPAYDVDPAAPEEFLYLPDCDPVKYPASDPANRCMIAYVAEIDRDFIATQLATDPAFIEPYLTMAVDVTQEDGSTYRRFIYSATDTGSISVGTEVYSLQPGVSVEARNISDDTLIGSPYTYNNPAWVSWLHLRTVYSKNDKEGNMVPVGSLYSLVRHYSYEWIATGIDK